MRLTAIVLVLSLTTPVVAAALCELTCAERHESAAASGEDCHKRQSAIATGTLWVSADPTCRHEAAGLASIVPAPSTLAAHPAIIQPAPVPLGLEAVQSIVSRGRPIRPPDLPPFSSRSLRI